MDVELLKSILACFGSASNSPTNSKTNTSQYDNDAEYLFALQNWVFAAKSAEDGDGGNAMKAFVEASGIEVIVACAKRYSGDTIVANRALEILAGERYSNGSLPLLEDKQACGKFVDLGLVEILLDFLRLPDLQAISRALACRALRCICQARQEVVGKIVKADGVEVLLSQICHVDEPYAFAALSALTRNESLAQDQVRSFPQSLPLLLTRFAEKPYDYCPDDDPAAAMLFLSVWTWDELKAEIKNLNDNATEAHDILKTASIGRYKMHNRLNDVVSPLLEYSTEIGNTYFYITTGEYPFLAVSCAGILFNATMSTCALKNPSAWKVVLNIVTMGYYNLFAESRVCWDQGRKTDALTRLKVFRGINAIIRFCVGTYSLLAYMVGVPAVNGLQLYIRWASIVSSLIFLLFANCDRDSRILEALRST